MINITKELIDSWGDCDSGISLFVVKFDEWALYAKVQPRQKTDRLISDDLIDPESPEKSV